MLEMFPFNLNSEDNDWSVNQINEGRERLSMMGDHVPLIPLQNQEQERLIRGIDPD